MSGLPEKVKEIKTEIAKDEQGSVLKDWQGNPLKNIRGNNFSLTWTVSRFPDKDEKNATGKENI